jgi:hypothetical protein
MINWKEYTAQGVQSVDMCAAAIYSHRLKNIPIKAIHLMPRMFGQFKQWMEKKAGRELTDEDNFQMDGVNIECGNQQQTTPLLIELWENVN